MIIDLFECNGRLSDTTVHINKRRKNVTKKRAIISKHEKRLMSRLLSFANRPSASVELDESSFDCDTSYTSKSYSISSSLDVAHLSSGMIRPPMGLIRSHSCLSSFTQENANTSRWSTLPNEILLKIFNYIGTFNTDNCVGENTRDDIICSTITAIRSVCKSWNCVVQSSKSLLACFRSITANRFIVAYGAENNTYKLRWCSYGSRKSRTLILHPNDIYAHSLLSYSFSQLDICRIVFQELRQDTFNDDFVAFMCAQFSRCRKFEPKHLCIKNSSMGALSSKGLHSLISFTATNLETFEISNVSGLRPDSITDAHMSELNISKLRRFTIECTKFNNHNKSPISLLQISDKTLEKFSRCGHFPLLALERCKVTVNGVVQYMEKWLVKDVETANEILRNVGSHRFTLRECPAVSDYTFRQECRRRSLDFEEGDSRVLDIDSGINSMSSSRRGSAESDSISYNIYHMKNAKEFLFTLSSYAEDKADFDGLN